MNEPYVRMQEAARAAARSTPWSDGIRRVRIVAKGEYREPYFCLDQENHWFLEDRPGGEAVPALTTAPRVCPPVWRDQQEWAPRTKSQQDRNP